MTVTELLASGLAVPLPTASAEAGPAATLITDEAAIAADAAEDLRVDSLVAEDALVAQGAPVFRLRHFPEIFITAPMPGRLASLQLGPGRRLSSARFFHEPEAGRHEYRVEAATSDTAALRRLLLDCGLWRMLRSRPFGKVPRPAEIPAAIFVTAMDTRPQAADPRGAVADRREDLDRGLDALTRLTEGPVFLCQDRGADIASATGRIVMARSEAIHPWGLAGFQVHRHYPASVARPVWDLHVEDAADIGALLATGLVPETRQVAVSGPAVKARRVVRCQPGADLRQLCHGYEPTGPHALLSGSALEGRESHWLRDRDRQVTVLGPAHMQRAGHWFLRALKGAARPLPLIPTAALDQAFGAALPAMPFLRALSAGDAETATKLGALSLVPEDLALVDYVTGAEPRLSALLAGMLAQIEAEEVA